MKNIKIIDAILFLLPDAQFVLVGDDYENIEWVDERPKPKIEELKKALEQIKLKKESDIQAKAAAQAKLAALGLTADDLKALGI